jgi:UDP-2,3-diacylglucosamine pyrophosphatase LpxH
MTDVADLIEHLLENYKEFMYNAEAVRKFTEEKELSQHDRLLLLNALADDEVFHWLDYIAESIPLVATDKYLFYGLIKKVIKEVRSDMAQGNFVNALIDLGLQKPDLSIKVYNALVESARKEQFMHHAGLLLGGIGRAKKEEARRFIQKQLDAAFRDYEKAAFIVATQVMLEAEKELDAEAQKFYSEILEKVTTPSQNQTVRAQSVLLAVVYYQKDPGRTTQYLDRTFEEPTYDLVVRSLIDRLWIKGIGDLQKEWEYVHRASTLELSHVGDSISHFLANKHKTNPNLAFEIFAMLLRHKDGGGSLYYVAEKLDSENREFFFSKVETLVTQEASIPALYELRHIIGHLSRREEAKRFSEMQTKIEKRISEVYKTQ